MSTPICTPGIVARRSGLVVTLVLLAGTVSAQSPTLLPYVAKLIAGGGTAVVGQGAKCPVSGFTSTDAYGDGCLATEIELGNVAAGAATPGSRDAVADANGNVFFSDYQNGLVRRVDAATGIVTAVAGGAAASPAANASCGAYTSTDARGDGCLGTAVHLSHPATLVFSPAPAGDLYFSDPGYGEIRKIAATNGFVPATGGIISLVMGNVGTTFGYAASNPTTSPATVVNASNSYVRTPLGLAFDNLGDLFVADEYYYTVSVLNTSSNTNVVNGVSVPAGTIYKIAGATTSNGLYCVNGTGSGSTLGCKSGAYVSGAVANASYLYNPFGIALDPAGNLYIANEYYDSVPVVSTTGTLTNFAGIESTVAKPAATTRGVAGTFAIGSPFGVAADSASDVYITDASSGYIWRVDGGSKTMYVVAGGSSTATVAGSPCASGSSYVATDTVGDGCPSNLAILGSSGTTFATTSLPGPGVYGIHTDANFNVYFGDTEKNLVREISSQAYFGVIGANQPTQTVIVHYAVGDGPAASGAYTLTPGTGNFTLGTPGTCTTNSDNTMDCPVPVQANPTVLGPFTGTLTVKSTLGATSAFTLGGIYAQSPKTRLAVTYADTVITCSGTTTYSNNDSILLTATLTANGPNPPSGTITFFANGAQVGSPQNVVNLGSVSNPVYGATLNYVFSTPNTYTISAVYSGDTAAPIYFTGSSGTAAATITTATPAFTLAATSNGTTTVYGGCPPGEIGQCVVTAGQTALYAVTLTETVYTGTITFSCSGAPANASCVVAPTSLTATGCSTTGTLAVSVLTSGGVPAQTAIGLPGSGPWQLLSMAFGIGLALLIGLRRRRLPLRGLWMVLALLLAGSGLVGCTSGTVNGLPITPKGTYTITVTATGSTGTTASVALPLTIQ